MWRANNAGETSSEWTDDGSDWMNVYQCDMESSDGYTEGDMNEGFEWNTGNGEFMDGQYATTTSDRNKAWQDIDHDVHEMADLETVEEGDGDILNAQEGSTALFKMKRRVLIPHVYFGPLFDQNRYAAVVKVSPVTFQDISKPQFSAIAGKANTFHLSLSKCGSVMKLFIEPQSLKGIIEGLLFMNFEHPMISVKVEMQSPDNSELIDEKPVSFPTVVNEVSFTVNSRYADLFRNVKTAANDNEKEEQKSLLLYNVPQSVESTLLRALFPFSQRCKLVSSDTRAAILQMGNAKVVHHLLTSITDYQINGQAIWITTADTPQLEFLQSLPEDVENVSPVWTRTEEKVPKKQKSRCPSDVRRDRARQLERQKRLWASASLTPAPKFPGIPSLLSMHVRPATTAAGVRKKTSAVTKSIGGRKIPFSGFTPSSWKKSTSAAGYKRPAVYMGQVSKRASAVSADKTGEPGTSTKYRASSYFRRSSARIAVHLAHIKAAETDPDAVIFPLGPNAVTSVPSKVSPKRLTHAQMEEIRTQNKVLLIEIQRAEDVWQRKLKEKLSANSGSYDLQETENTSAQSGHEQNPQLEGGKLAGASCMENQHSRFQERATAAENSMETQGQEQKSELPAPFGHRERNASRHLLPGTKRHSLEHRVEGNIPPDEFERHALGNDRARQAYEDRRRVEYDMDRLDYEEEMARRAFHYDRVRRAMDYEYEMEWRAYEYDMALWEQDVMMRRRAFEYSEGRHRHAHPRECRPVGPRHYPY